MPSKPLDLARALAAAACIACALQPLAASAQAADKPEKADVKVCLGWTFVATQAPFPYGVDQGFFKAAGLDVTVDRGAGAGSSIQRVVSGAYDFGYADIGTLAVYNAEHPDRPVVAVYIAEDESPLTLITLEGKGITRPKDVEGKRIAVSQFDGARLMFPVFARVNHVDSASITWKTVDAQMREMMLARGEVDAITAYTTTSIPLLASMHQKPKAIRYSDNGVVGFGQAVVVTREFAQKNPNTVRAFVRAFNESLKGMIAHPGDALASLKQRDGLVNLDTERFRMKLLVSELILTPAVKKNGLSSADPQRLAATIENVRQVTPKATALTVDSVYTARFLPPQAERMPGVFKP
jgi:NitT/TauT family transport system substrate-binding protein